MRSRFGLIFTLSFLLLTSITVSEAAKSPTKTKITPAAQYLDKFLPAIENKDDKKMAKAIHDLQDELESSFHKGRHLDNASRKKLSTILLQRARRVNRKATEGEHAYLAILELAVRHGEWNEVRDEVLSAFETTTLRKPVRLLRALSSKSTSLSDEEAVREINALASRKLIDKRDRWREVLRINPKRYMPEMKKELSATKNPKDFKLLALIIQSHDDDTIFTQAIPRIKELGLDKADANGGFSWIDHRLFAKHLQKVSGEELVSALEVLEMGGGSVISAAPIILKRDLINHSDKRVRAVAAHQIAKAVGAREISPDAAEALFRDRLSKENDAEVIRRLKRGLSALRGYRKAFKRLEALERAK